MLLKRISRRTLVAAASALFLFLPGTAPAQNQTSTLSPVVLGGNLPYQISLRVYNMGGSANVPTLQSYAFGKFDGQWVLLGGRTNGLHDFSNDGFLNFPPAYQNTFVWVIDPVTKQTWSRSLEDPSAGLTTQQVDSLSATNMECLQRGDRLYVAGGYVYDRTIDNFTTYDRLTALDLPGVIAWVKTGAGSLAANIRQTSDSLLQVAGGEMHFIDGRAFLVFGQNFEGPYTSGADGAYTREVRTFDIVDDGITLSIANPAVSIPLPEYRRRDLNVVPMLTNDGADEGLIAFAGVFLPGPTGGAWTVPVEIDATGTPSMADPNAADTFKQGMNTYRSATVSLYSPTLDETHTIALGGISLEYFDPATGAITYDPLLPFINGITSIVRTEAGDYTQFYLGEFPAVPNPSNGNAPFLFGAGADFFPATGIPAYANGMLALDEIVEPTVIGYVFGGLIAQQPNFGASGASNLIFEVVYTPVYPPGFHVAGKNRRTTRAKSFVLRGSAEQSTDTIEWRVIGRGNGYRSQPVESDGSWQIRVSNLRSGSNIVRLRGVNLNGVATPTRDVTIVRK